MLSHDGNPIHSDDRGGLTVATVRLTVAQALVRFLANQYSERDGVERRLVLAVGGVGATGSAAANALAREADVVLGAGTRYSDFTTASRTAFQNPDVRFVNLNVT